MKTDGLEKKQFIRRNQLQIVKKEVKDISSNN